MELPLSMLSNNEGGLTATELAVKIGAANSLCKISSFLKYQLSDECYLLIITDFAEGLISRGGFYLNSVRVGSVSETVCPERHLLQGNFTVARVGKH